MLNTENYKMICVFLMAIYYISHNIYIRIYSIIHREKLKRHYE